MKRALFILFVLFVAGCKNKTEDIKEIYGNGNTSRTFQRIDGKIEGKMVDYYSSGAVKGERFFKNNQQADKTTLYYENGEVMEVQYYKNGLKNGGDTVFYESGKPKFSVFLVDDKKDGFLRKWDENGNITYEAKFKMDKLVEVNGEQLQ